MAEIQSRWHGFVESQANAGGAIDPNALVQEVLRESYLQTTEDLEFFAEKVKYFNDFKKAIRDYLDDLRDYDASAKAGQSNRKPIPQSEVDQLRLALFQMITALRNKRMIEKAQSLGSDQKARQVLEALLRRPFKR